MEIRRAKIADIEPLMAVASHDSNHAIIRPTLVAIDNGEFLGYTSFGEIPMLVFWMDTKRAKPRQTLNMWLKTEEALRSSGHSMVFAPCMSGSPLRPFISRLGFRSHGVAELFSKTL